jgi:hypothetical protein
MTLFYVIINTSNSEEIMDSRRLEAAKLGKKSYDGKPCKNCGGTHRYVLSDGCIVCMKAAVAKQRNKLKELKGNN